VSKNTYPYPPDEFDSVDPRSRPQEVHAARRSTWSKVWPFIVVVIVVPVIALGVVKFLSSWERPPADPAANPTTTSTTTQTVTDPPTTPDDSAAIVDDDVPSDDAPTTPPELDRTVDVRVLNAKGEQGLAGRAADLLRQDGWATAEPDDYDGDAAEGNSAVYYGKNAWSTSAQAVAGILGIDLVEKDTDGSPDGITVVLRQDFVL
jgi:hypothetical protein